MSNWEKFEIDCKDYLNKTFKEYAVFIHKGCSDSTIPDILVKTKRGKSFYIDVKLSPAQCGQFVLLPNIEKKVFEYSSKNVNPCNTYANKIIEFMNDYFETFKNAGTAGKNIVFPNSEDVFSNWIIKIYSEKGVKFFITNSNIILPVERFKDYFNVTATYRIKRSGSCSVKKCRFEKVQDYILSCDYSICDINIIDGKLFVISEKDIDNHRFIFDKYEYMFAKRGNIYEIRQLSNTYNANVIFSIELKNSVIGLSEEEFIKELIS